MIACCWRALSSLYRSWIFCISGCNNFIFDMDSQDSVGEWEEAPLTITVTSKIAIQK